MCKALDYPAIAAAATMRLAGNHQAIAHMQRYLKGNGIDFIENAFLAKVLQEDAGVQSAIARNIPKGRKTFAGHFFLRQSDYALSDPFLAWGGVRRLDFEVNFSSGTLHVWFQDRYEWHPYYPGIYTVHAEDATRETNCVHAAFVEMKTRGAKDYWMIGEATVPASVLPAAAGSAPDKGIAI
jgi:hypothetical protein